MKQHLSGVAVLCKDTIAYETMAYTEYLSTPAVSPPPHPYNVRQLIYTGAFMLVWNSFLRRLIIAVRLPLQSATPPH
jgi:hypothetical protein